ncbi:MAG: hypothetical protein Kow0056_07190 [Coriobacteriia bacterium]
MFAAEPTGFEAFWTQFLNYAYPALQMLYWLVMIAVALVAVSLFKKWVNHQTGSDARAEASEEGPGTADEPDEEISVEEFVD